MLICEIFSSVFYVAALELVEDNIQKLHCIFSFSCKDCYSQCELAQGVAVLT